MSHRAFLLALLLLFVLNNSIAFESSSTSPTVFISAAARTDDDAAQQQTNEGEDTAASTTSSMMDQQRRSEEDINAHDFFFDPRSELRRDQTSGEETWLTSSTRKGTGINFAGGHHTPPHSHPTTTMSAVVPVDNKEQESGSSDGGNNPSSQSATTGRHHQLILSPFDEEFHTENTYLLSIIQTRSTETAADEEKRHILAQVIQSYERHKSPDSSYTLGVFHLYGFATLQPNIGRAAYYFRIAARNGHNDAQCALGLLLYHGIGTIGKDVKGAMRWFYRASSSDFGRGHWLLGRALFQGMWEEYGDIIGRAREGSRMEEEEESNNSTTKVLGDDTVSPDLKEAARLFGLASKSNIGEATHHLALMYEYNLISDREEEDENEIQPSSSSSRSYSSSSPEAKNHLAKAASLYQIAIEQNSIESIYNLALMHAHGRGVQQDFVKSTELFRIAGLRYNHVPSIRYLGLFAVHGYGTTVNGMPDYDMAIQFFDLCASAASSSVDRGVISGSSGAVAEASEQCRKEKERLMEFMGR